VKTATATFSNPSPLERAEWPRLATFTERLGCPKTTSRLYQSALQKPPRQYLRSFSSAHCSGRLPRSLLDSGCVLRSGAVLFVAQRSSLCSLFLTIKQKKTAPPLVKAPERCLYFSSVYSVDSSPPQKCNPPRAPTSRRCASSHCRNSARFYRAQRYDIRLSTHAAESVVRLFIGNHDQPLEFLPLGLR